MPINSFPEVLQKPTSIYVSSSPASLIEELNSSIMEKVKEFKDQVVGAGKKGKEKLEEIQKKEWAEPTGKALKAAAGVASAS